jgi:subtilisin-like proprotein convertase family protein
MTISGITSGAAGLSTVTVTGSGGGGSIIHNSPVQLQVDAPGVPTLIAPADTITTATTQPLFQWSPVVGATSYTLEVATDVGFTNIVYTATVGITSNTPGAALAVGTSFWWRVRAGNTCGSGPNSLVFTFTTPVLYCRTPNQAIPDSNATGVNDDLVIAAGGTITDLNLYIKATHTWVGDLRFTLTKVSGPSVIAFDRPGVPASTFGCNSDNLDNILDDEGAGGAVETACPVAAGVTYTPNNPLSAVDGQTLAGTWRLNSADLAASDTGTLLQWCIAPIALPLLIDGFESGTLGAWAGHTPP